MRILRRVPPAFTRHLRAASASHGNHNASFVSRIPSRVECGASRCLSTVARPTTRATSPRMLSTSTATSAPAEPSPAIVMLQTLAEWQGDGHIHSIPNPSKKPTPLAAVPSAKPVSLTKRNRSLQTAIEKGDFHGAQQRLRDLLQHAPARGAHPVDTENYDRLLFQWSRLSTQRLRTRGDADNRPVDLSPMLSLLEAMTVWNRVNARSFNTALVVCHRLRALDAGERVLAIMKRAGRVPKAFAYTNLISCCARLASTHKGRQDAFVADAERFFHELVDGGTGVTIEAVNAMVFAYRAASGRSCEAVDLVERARREWKLAPDTSTLATLTVCLLKDGNALEAARWVEYALHHRVRLDEPIVRSVVDACRRDSHWDKVESLAEMLQQRGVAQRDHALMQILRQSRARQPLAATTASVLPTTDKQTIVQSKKQLKSDAAVMLAELIRTAGSLPARKLSKAEWGNIFEHGRINQLDELVRLVRLPESCVVLPSGVTMAWLSQGYLRALDAAGEWWRVVDAIDEMLEATPRDVNVYCFNAAIRACTRAGRLHEAVRVLERMERMRTTLQPNRETYDALIQCCGVIGSVEGALRYFREMQRSGLEPTINDVNAVLKAFGNAVHRLIEASHDASSELDVPASDLSALAVHALQFFEDATAKYDDTVEINETTVFHLFRSFLGAAEVFDTVDLGEFAAFSDDDDHAHRESHGEWIVLSNAIQQICRDAPPEIVSPRVINIAIDFFQRRGEPDSAFELFNTMVSREIAPTADTVRLLFAACCNGDENAQLGLFFLEHLISDMGGDDRPPLGRVVAREALRWAGRMATSTTDGSPDLVDTVFDKLVAAGILSLEPSVYQELVGVYAHDGNIMQAKRVVYRMLADTGAVSIGVANRLLQACSVARAPVAALDSLAWIKRQGVEPDVVSYNNVLSAIRRRRVVTRRHMMDGEEENVEEDASDSDEEESDPEDAEYEDSADDGQRDRYRESKGRPRREDDLEATLTQVVDDLLGEMQGQGIRGHARTFESAVAIASQRGEMRRVVELFDRINAAARARRVEASELLTEQSIHQYLDACAALGSEDSAGITGRVEELRLRLATWYSERGYKVASGALQRLIYAYDAVGQWREAVALLKNASDVYGVTPGVEMYRAVMEVCNRVGQHKAAEQIFVTMQTPGASGRVVPDAASYVEAIHAIEQQGNWIQATQLFMEMQKKCPSEELHPSLLHRIALGRYAEGRKRPD